jgi:hypothetical protein
MLLHLPIVIAATLSPVAVSDTVPQFDIVRECRFEGEFDRCSEDEGAALRELQETWAQFAGADRKTCTTEATIGDFASYVELLSCLEMTRDAKSTREPRVDPESHKPTARRQPHYDERS